MEDKQTILTKAKTASAKISYYSRILVGREIDGEAERFLCKKLRRRLFFVLLYFALSLLFGLTQLLFAATPLGLALFSATTGVGAIASLFGLLLAAAFSPHPIIALLIPLLGCVLRLLVSHTLPQKGYFHESISLRVAISAVLGFLFAFASSAMAKFSMESVYALVFMTIMTPLITRVFAFATDNSKDSIFHEPARLAILFFLVYALNIHGAFGFSLGIIAAFFITLSVAITNGALRATLVGVITGLACGLPYAPIFAVAGLCTGLCANLSITYSALASLALAAVMNLYLNSASNMLAFTGDLFFAILLFLPLAHAGLIPQIAFFADEPAELPEMKYVDDVKKKYRKNRLRALSQAFEDLSDIFLELSEKSRKPGNYEIHEAGDEVFSHYCKKCTLNHICWQREYNETSEALDKVYEKVQKGEPALTEDLPEAFGTRCRQMEKILRDINNAAADLVEKAVRRDKTELFALDYEAMAELLAETAGDNEDEFEADKPLCRKASAALKELGISAIGYSAWGARRKTILASGVEIASLSASAHEIKTALEKATGLLLTEPHFDFNGDFVTMRVDSLPAISAEVASAFCAKEQEGVSGDSLSVFDGPCNNRFLLSCDGMGSGKTAAVTARISTVFLEKMLSAGNKKGVVLKMLSNFLRSKSEECHSTADLVELDFLSSRALFTKCGAAPSFVLHNGNLFRVDCRSVPIGITREIDTEEIETPIHAGDLIIMMSDGIIPTEEDIFRLTETLTDSASLSPKEIADKILSLATQKDSAEKQNPDDCSVLVARITAA
ncbi:MAG: SpoIIE family protein phosphatase [Clostridia bacterium]|nr:SpoIIE family protein phosphatase [Clostridia bacterium]